MRNRTRRPVDVVSKSWHAQDDSIERRIGERITVKADGCWLYRGKGDVYAKPGSLVVLTPSEHRLEHIRLRRSA